MRALLLLVITSMAIAAFGQDAPVKFIPIDSIAVIPAGQKVKLDFKTKEKNVGQYPRVYPSLRGAKFVSENMAWVGDTVDLEVAGEKITFIERKGKTVDWYLFMMERLESRTYKKGHSLVISDGIIQNIKGDSILFRLTLDLYKPKNRKLKKVSSRTHDVWIKSNQLDGLLISEVEK